MRKQLTTTVLRHLTVEGDEKFYLQLETDIHKVFIPIKKQQADRILEITVDPEKEEPELPFDFV